MPPSRQCLPEPPWWQLWNLCPTRPTCFLNLTFLDCTSIYDILYIVSIPLFCLSYVPPGPAVRMEAPLGQGDVKETSIEQALSKYNDIKCLKWNIKTKSPTMNKWSLFSPQTVKPQSRQAKDKIGGEKLLMPLHIRYKTWCFPFHLGALTLAIAMMPMDTSTWQAQETRVETFPLVSCLSTCCWVLTWATSGKCSLGSHTGSCTQMGPCLV